ncbi:tyrosine-protein phosphatase [Rhodococcus jostii]|uniref:Tyrosine-protein phosphatase n=1 Tax=Rhodococcus jostii TaxID=132919 RepID=A0ABU4C9Z7_RHOJO|nr:tyrosine-protein phosphatase [Rhodococcus jostii]MDV6280105.1 tyrosine-protein phosphatase [Rhodococcus jostii]
MRTAAIAGALLLTGYGAEVAHAQPEQPPALSIPAFGTGSLGSWPIAAAPRLGSVDNFRDVAGPGAGYLAEGGKRVVPGLIYRSNALTPNDFDYAALHMVGLTAVYDLRTDGEIAKHPDRIPVGAHYTHVPILTDAQGAEFMAAVAGLQIPEQTREAMREMERMLVTDEGARAGFRQLLTNLADTDGPQVVHCTSGKDRTGWATALLLSIAGVARETIVDDYLLTNEYSAASIKAALDDAAAVHGEQVAQILAPLYGVEASYLDAGFTQVEQSYGSFDNYLIEGLGLDQNIIAKLRAKLVQ